MLYITTILLDGRRAEGQIFTLMGLGIYSRIPTSHHQL